MFTLLLGLHYPYFLRTGKQELLLKTRFVLLQIFNSDRGNYFTRSLQLQTRLTKHATAGKNFDRLPSGPDITPPDILETKHFAEGQVFTLIICTAKGKSQFLRCLVRASGFFCISDSKRYTTRSISYKQLTPHPVSVTGIYTQTGRDIMHY